MHQAYRRPFGTHPVPLLGALGSLALFVSIILLVGGSPLAGLFSLALAIALLMLFAGGVRREPDAPAARPTLLAAEQIRSHTKLASVSGRAWLRAGVELLRIRYRQHQLRSELKASLAPLGEAVHKDDDDRARALKRQAEELERELLDAERQASGAIANARQEVAHEQVTIQAGATEPASPRLDRRRG